MGTASGGGRTDPPDSRHGGPPAAARRTARRARRAGNRAVSGWLMLCGALLAVYLVAVLAVANLLEAIRF